MGLREFSQKRPKTTAALSGIATIASIAFLIHGWRERKNDLPVFPDKAYFTVDDGATWFVDSDTKVPPFLDQNGREAVRANLFTCDARSHLWVQYLEKYTDQAKSAFELLQAGKSLPPNMPGPLAGKLVKRPGDSKWILVSNAAALAIMTPKCPDGDTSATPQSVTP